MVEPTSDSHLGDDCHFGHRKEKTNFDEFIQSTSNLAGFGAGSDKLPDRFTKEPSTMKGSKGNVCELDKMLAEYYTERGWVNGVVPESKLKELGIL